MVSTPSFLLVVPVLLAQGRNLGRQALHLLRREQGPLRRIESDQLDEDGEQDDGDAPVAREPIEELEHGQHGTRQNGEGDVHVVRQVRVLAGGPHFV